MPKHPAFGPMTYAEFQKLVNAPFGVAKKRLDNPYDVMAGELVDMVVSKYIGPLRDPVADEEFLAVTVDDMICDIIEVLDRWKRLKP